MSFEDKALVFKLAEEGVPLSHKERVIGMKLLPGALGLVTQVGAASTSCNTCCWQCAI